MGLLGEGYGYACDVECWQGGEKSGELEGLWWDITVVIIAILDRTSRY